MSDEQKYLLYIGFLEQPLPEQIHASYVAQSVATIDSSTAKQLRKMGYSPDAVGRIRDQLEKAGLK